MVGKSDNAITDWSTSARRAYNFIDSIGFNTHVTFFGLSSANTSYITANMASLGVYHIRDNNNVLGEPNGPVTSAFNTVTAAGAKLYLAWNDFANGLSGFVTQAKELWAANPGCLTGFEGPNEIDNGGLSYGGKTSYAAANQAQTDLYNAIRNGNIPDFNNIPITAWPLAFQANAASQGNLSAVADYGNMHDYFFSDYSTRLAVQTARAMAANTAVVGSKRTVATEMGWSTATLSSDTFGVSQDLQAKLMLCQFLDHFKQGVVRTYMYELIDDAADAGNTKLQNHFGIYDSANNPKQAATNLKSFIAILSDTDIAAPFFLPGSLNYMTVNMPAGAQQMLLQKSSGAFDIILWGEPTRLWTRGAPGSEARISSTNVTVVLPRVFSSVKAYDPLVGVTAQQTLTNVSSIVVGVKDHPVVVEVI